MLSQCCALWATNRPFIVELQDSCARDGGNLSSMRCPPNSMNSGIARAALAAGLMLCCEAVAQAPRSQADQLARHVVANEIKAENQDHSHWMFRLDTKKPDSSEEVNEIVETKDGDLSYPILIDGRKPSQQQAQQAEAKLRKLESDPSELRKSQHEQNQDEEQSQRMLKLLPRAFLFEPGEQRGNLVELKFKPSPQFKPPNREATVFHAMEGSLWVDKKQARIARIIGHLTHEVKFGEGILGHLDQGGRFEVTQEEVAPGFWELTALNVDMNGKALFFKTISVKQKYTRGDFKRVPDNLSVARGVQMLRKQLASEKSSGH